MSATRIRIALLAFALTAASCGGPPDGPRWIHLARPTADAPQLRGEALAPDSIDFVREPGDVRVVQGLARADWTRVDNAQGEPSRWEARQLPIAIGRPAPGREAYELGEFTFDSDTLNFGAQAGAFTVTAGKVWLTLDPGAEPASELVLSIAATHQVIDGDRWLLSGRRIGGEGLAVWPGQSMDLWVDVPPHSTLRFGTAKESGILKPGLRAEEHFFRVFVEDEPVFEYVEKGTVEAAEWHALELPAQGGDRMHIRLEVEGPYAFTAFLDPVVGPTEIGSYGDRPWGAGGAGGHDDVVVFLADTFRADNMAAYGGTAGLAPNLDRFAESALTFTDVWSVSTHTLPTHSTLFSGVYPRQNGQVDYWNALPDSVDTLAEYLARQGYRTVAITDGIMVSQTHGMSQGFAWFDERRNGLDATLARVNEALAADDGRPLFLFVQSYATHAPFTIRAATRERLGDMLDAGAPIEAFMGRIKSTPGTQVIDRSHPGTGAAVAGIRTLYEASVADLDDGFADLLAAWQGSGILTNGWLLMTSDHGEALGEHDRLFHAGVTYEEVLRVPLVIHGPRAKPRLESRPVSLIDFAPTVADMAGVPAPENWIGRSLLGERDAGPRFAFQCRGASSVTTLAVIDDGKKLIGYENLDEHVPGDWWAAYNLSVDPLEESDLWDDEPLWARDLARRIHSELTVYLTPVLEAEVTQLTADQRRAINDMGYAGDDEGE